MDQGLLVTVARARAALLGLSAQSPGPRGSVDHTLTSMADRSSLYRCVLSNSQSVTQGSARLLIKVYKNHTNQIQLCIQIIISIFYIFLCRYTPHYRSSKLLEIVLFDVFSSGYSECKHCHTHAHVIIY